jgi:hypothetical protein
MGGFMLERGRFSFVALLVINPIAILLFQNFTLLPATQNELATADLTPQKRAVSSMTTPEKVNINKLMRVASPTIADCKGRLKNCPISNE